MILMVIPPSCTHILGQKIQWGGGGRRRFFPHIRLTPFGHTSATRARATNVLLLQVSRPAHPLSSRQLTCGLVQRPSGPHRSSSKDQSRRWHPCARLPTSSAAPHAALIQQELGPSEESAPAAVAAKALGSGGVVGGGGGSPRVWEETHPNQPQDIAEGG